MVLSLGTSPFLENLIPQRYTLVLTLPRLFRPSRGGGIKDGRPLSGGQRLYGRRRASRGRGGVEREI